MNSNKSKISCKRGFTLIELLVVVLIIGILAAVAVPQYKKAVERARASEAFTNLRNLVVAEKVYQMTNGVSTNNLSSLDLELSGVLYFRYYVISYDSMGISYDSVGKTDVGPEGFEVVAERKDNENDNLKYYIYYDWNGRYRCVSKDVSARWICQTLSGQSNSIETHDNGYEYYDLKI